MYLHFQHLECGIVVWVLWYGYPAIASDVVNSTSVRAHIEVTAVSRVKLHTEHVHRGAKRCKGSGKGRKQK